MKAPRFIQITDLQDRLYALDEEGKVWRYEEDASADGPAWKPLSSRRLDAPAEEPAPTVGFRASRPRKA